MQDYDIEKWKMIMDVTQSNYSNMIKRLNRKATVSNFILTYYSIILIVYTLTNKYYSEYFNDIFSEYCSIILSIVILVYSLINSNANYNVRVIRIERSLNSIKDLKRKLKINSEKFEEHIKNYTEIVNSTERREDVDFFITVKHLCKEIGISWVRKKKYNSRHYKNRLESNGKEIQVINYLSEVNCIYEEVKLVAWYLLNIMILILPIFIFIICFYVPRN